MSPKDDPIMTRRVRVWSGSRRIVVCGAGRDGCAGPRLTESQTEDHTMTRHGQNSAGAGETASRHDALHQRIHLRRTVLQYAAGALAAGALGAGEQVPSIIAAATPVAAGAGLQPRDALGSI